MKTLSRIVHFLEKLVNLMNLVKNMVFTSQRFNKISMSLKWNSPQCTLLSCKLSFQLIWSIYTSFDLYRHSIYLRSSYEANNLYLAIFKQHWGKKDVSIQLIFQFTANLIQLGRLNEFNQFAVRLLAEDMLKNCCLYFVRRPCFPKIYFFLFFLFNPSIFKCL